MAILMEVVCDKTEEEIDLFTLWDFIIESWYQTVLTLGRCLKASELIKYHI